MALFLREPPPLYLLVAIPTLAAAALALAAEASPTGGAAPLEEIKVLARKPRDSDSDLLLAGPFTPGAAPAPVSSIAELAELQPGVAFAGQGGLLQTLSIRGLSGQQVANFWGEVPVLGDRRAGTASSFIDPSMLGSVEILRGPASVFYGSGAGAGVLQFSPARPQGLEATLQWGSDGNENLQYLGIGGDSASVALSRRSADDGDSATGERLHDRFDQYNGQLLWSGEFSGNPLSFRQLFSEGRDIGKSNNRYPDRITDYPEERHWLGELSTVIGERLEASAYYHYQSLDTRVETVGESISDISSESIDWGFRAAWRFHELRAGLEYLGRRDVQSDEREISLTSGDRVDTRTLDADQDGIDLFLDGSRALGGFDLAAGLRWSWIEQRANDSTDDTALSGFLRASAQPSPSLGIHLELSSGTRFASLGERFFSGTTGRGQVLGNPALSPEETLSLDLGLSYERRGATASLRGYATRIDDYIERTDLTPDLRSFRNLSDGDIVGVEAALGVPLGDTLSLQLGGHYIDSEGGDGNALANVAAPEVFAVIAGDRAQWSGRLRLGYRFSRGDVAPGEAALDSATTLTASLSRRWRELEFTLWGRNLLDDDYRLSSDELSTTAPERSLGVTLSWRKPAG